MREALKSNILELLPELKKALAESGSEVTVSGVSISRLVAEKIYEEFNYELHSKTKKCNIDWDLIPLKLIASDCRWRNFQKSLNQVDKI